MAQTIIGVNDAKTNHAWAKKSIVEALQATLLNRLTSSSVDDPSMPVHIRDELKAGGDRITIHLRRQLTGKGVMGDAEAGSQAEALSFLTDKLYIDQLRHSVNVTGLASQQRVPWAKRNEASSGLADWWAGRWDTWLMNQAAGNTAQIDLEYTGLNAVTAPTTNRRVFGGTATAASGLVSSDFRMTLSLIDKCVLKAKTARPKIRPIKIGGKEYFVLLIHPNQAFDLRTNMSEGDWAKLQLAAMQGGRVNDNPLITGANACYASTLIIESERVPFGDNQQETSNALEYHTDLGAPANGVTNVARGIFMGAQAIGMAFGRDGGPERLRWVEELKDGENQLQIYAGAIAGLKKMVFGSEDFATITVDTYSPTR